MEFWTKGGITDSPHATRVGQGEARPPDDHAGKFFPANRRRTSPNRASEAAVAATVGHRTFLDFSAILDHFRPTHTSLPPFLDPLNSFSWSLFADSSPFESYDENKVGQRLDQVFRPPQQLLDQGNGTDEFLVSWDFH